MFCPYVFSHDSALSDSDMAMLVCRSLNLVYEQTLVKRMAPLPKFLFVLNDNQQILVYYQAQLRWQACKKVYNSLHVSIVVMTVNEIM